MTRVLGKKHVDFSERLAFHVPLFLIDYLEEEVLLPRQLNSVPVVVFSALPVFLIAKFLSNSFLGS